MSGRPRAPNGYTLPLPGAIYTMAPAVIKNLNYDPANAFVFISLTGSTKWALSVNTMTMPAQDLEEFLAVVRAQPGRFHYATPGSGSPHHFGFEMFKQGLELDVVYVPYKGAAGAMTDPLRGQVQVMLVPEQSVPKRSGRDGLHCPLRGRHDWGAAARPARHGGDWVRRHWLAGTAAVLSGLPRFGGINMWRGVTRRAPFLDGCSVCRVAPSRRASSSSIRRVGRVPISSPVYLLSASARSGISRSRSRRASVRTASLRSKRSRRARPMATISRSRASVRPHHIVRTLAEMVLWLDGANRFDPVGIR